MTATSEVSRVRLEDPGSSVEIRVEYVSPEKIGEFDYWLVGGHGVETLIPRKSLDPQLDRVGVATAEELVGQVIRLSRSTTLNKYKKPYWNLDGVKGGSSAPKPSAPKGPAPRVLANVSDKDLPPYLQNAAQEDAAELSAKVGFDVATIQKELALYQALAEFVTRDIAPLYEKSGVGMSPESAAASVQTLFINITGGKK